MKKLALLGAVVAFAAPVAFAEVVTIEFAQDDGETQVWHFNQETGMAKTGDIEVPYTYDAEASTICGQMEEGELCATFAEAGEPTVGESSAYTTSDGNSGTATITAIETAAPSGS